MAAFVKFVFWLLLSWKGVVFAERSKLTTNLFKIPKSSKKMQTLIAQNGRNSEGMVLTHAFQSKLTSNHPKLSTNKDRINQKFKFQMAPNCSAGYKKDRNKVLFLRKYLTKSFDPEICKKLPLLIHANWKDSFCNFLGLMILPSTFFKKCFL